MNTKYGEGRSRSVAGKISELKQMRIEMAATCKPLKMLGLRAQATTGAVWRRTAASMRSGGIWLKKIASAIICVHILAK